MHAETIAEAIFLGIIEGLTEFIPVSSTAHLLLASRFLGFESTGKVFEVLIQLGAILALLSVYAARLTRLLFDMLRDRRSQLFVLGIVLAFLPAAFLGVLLHHFITTVLFNSPVIICIALIVGGAALLYLDRMELKPRFHDIMDFPLRVSFGIGVFQCLALVPGVSRSGATIAGALLLGTDKRSAAEFSFFLAMPTMLGAFVYDLYKNWGNIDSNAAWLIAIGFVAAFISAVVVVKSFLGFVSRHGFAFFAWWRLVVGVAGLIGLYLTSGSAPRADINARSSHPAPVVLAVRAEPHEIAR